MDEKGYPEHLKLEKVKDKSQTCGEFLEWLHDAQEIYLAHYVPKYLHSCGAKPNQAFNCQYNHGAFCDHYDASSLCCPDVQDIGDKIVPEEFVVLHTSIEDLLGQFFGIDRKKLEQEKRQMLDEIRSANDTHHQTP
jgi:hypothetical protein